LGGGREERIKEFLTQSDAEGSAKVRGEEEKRGEKKKGEEIIPPAPCSYSPIKAFCP
jgi:hypothetical protein